MSNTMLPAPGRYQHYKGAEYEVLHCARHSETEEWLVVSPSRQRGAGGSVLFGVAR